MLHSVMSSDVSNVVYDDSVEVLAAKTFQVRKNWAKRWHVHKNITRQALEEVRSRGSLNIGPSESDVGFYISTFKNELKQIAFE